MFLPPPPPPLPPDGGGVTPAPDRSRGGVFEGGSPGGDDFRRNTLVEMKLLDKGCLLYTEHSMPEKKGKFYIVFIVTACFKIIFFFC